MSCYNNLIIITATPHQFKHKLSGLRPWHLETGVSPRLPLPLTSADGQEQTIEYQCRISERNVLCAESSNYVIVGDEVRHSMELSLEESHGLMCHINTQLLTILAAAEILNLAINGKFAELQGLR
jgi:hypothetical protein